MGGENGHRVRGERALLHLINEQSEASDGISDWRNNTEQPSGGRAFDLTFMRSKGRERERKKSGPISRRGLSAHCIQYTPASIQGAIGISICIMVGFVQPRMNERMDESGH